MCHNDAQSAGKRTVQRKMAEAFAPAIVPFKRSSCAATSHFCEGLPRWVPMKRQPARSPPLQWQPCGASCAQALPPLVRLRLELMPVRRALAALRQLPPTAGRQALEPSEPLQQELPPHQVPLPSPLPPPVAMLPLPTCLRSLRRLPLHPSSSEDDDAALAWAFPLPQALPPLRLVQPLFLQTPRSPPAPRLLGRLLQPAQEQPLLRFRPRQLRLPQRLLRSRHGCAARHACRAAACVRVPVRLPAPRSLLPVPRLRYRLQRFQAGQLRSRSPRRPA